MAMEGNRAWIMKRVAFSIKAPSSNISKSFASLPKGSSISLAISSNPIYLNVWEVGEVPNTIVREQENREAPEQQIQVRTLSNTKNSKFTS